MHEGTFAALEPDDCRALLRTQEVGRVAWASATAGLLVLPVNYVVQGDLVVFRSSPDSELAELAEGREVAFQIDDVDVETGNAWSVLVRGVSGRPQAGPEAEASPGRSPQPWAPGERDLYLSIRVDEISGRVVDRAEK